MIRRADAVAALLLLALVPSLAHADQVVVGTIKYACVTPTLTKNGPIIPMLGPNDPGANGVCGYKFAIAAGTTHYVLTPSKPADLDIHFYNATGDPVDSLAGAEGYCGSLSDPVVSGAAYAIVVATPGVCASVSPPNFSAQVGPASNVGFTYSAA